MTFSPDEIATLTRIAGQIIPASEAYDVPGADDPAILANILTSAARDADTVRRALADFAASPDAEGFKATYPDGAMCLQSIVAFCYYRDPRVLVSLGRSPEPPFPKGHQMIPSDWSLLEPMKNRAPIWRSTK